MEPTDSDQPRYQLRNRTTVLLQSLPVCHKRQPCLMLICRPIDGRMAEGRSEGEATDASQGSSPHREMPQLSPILEVEQDSQTTSSVISDTPPTLQPVTISPYARVAIDTQTHSARPVNIAHPQCAITQPTISTSAADAHDTTPQTITTTTIRPLSKITVFFQTGPQGS